MLAATLVVLNLPSSTQADEKDSAPTGGESAKEKPGSNGDTLALRKQQAATQNNLKNLALSLLNYEAANKSFPPRANFDASGKPLLSWRVLVLPYLDPDEAKLYEEFHLDEPWDSEHNLKLVARMPKVFKNPRIDRPGFTNYLAVVGSECMFDGTAKGIRLAQVSDGTANTIALVEADADQAVEWTKPQDWEFDRAHPTAGLGGLWPDHWFAFRVDGSSCRVSNKSLPDEVGIQFTRAGGETKNLSESAGHKVAPPENSQQVEVPFAMGASRFAVGDEITITEVRGTADTFEPGNAYRIKGTYTLASRDSAKIMASVTAKNPADGTGAIRSIQTNELSRGSGTFTLELRISAPGWPHVSFYPADGGQSFGGVYFGTDDSVLQNWQAVYGSDNARWAESGTTAHRVKFPSLEDQKLADLAWKRLGLELEPIGEEELKRVRAIGYDGGLKVINQPHSMSSASDFQQGDALVGLHVWPTTSLKDVAEVLNRDDLAELNPLKFYVVRTVTTGYGRGYGGGRASAGEESCARLHRNRPGHSESGQAAVATSAGG